MYSYVHVHMIIYEPRMCRRIYQEPVAEVAVPRLLKAPTMRKRIGRTRRGRQWVNPVDVPVQNWTKKPCTTCTIILCI